MKTEYLNRFPLFNTHQTAERDAYTLCIILSIGLTMFTPFLSLVTPLPTLGWVVIVGLIYGVTALVIGRVAIGVYVSLIVSMMFAANIPLSSRGYLMSMTRDIGPSIWFAHIPLFILLSVLFVRDKEQFLQLHKSELFLGIFVGWVILASVVTQPTRLDTALYFALFVFWGGLVFAAVRRVHQMLPVSPRTTMILVSISVLANSVFALTEIFHGDSYGLTNLGELSPEYTDQIAEITFGSITLPVGTFVSGFSGMSFILASIIILVLPFVLSSLLEGSLRIQIIGAASALILILVLRFTASDAARGGALLAIGMFSTLTLIILIKKNISTNRRTLAIFLTIMILCTGIVLFPSTMSGTPSEQLPQQDSQSTEEQAAQKESAESSSAVEPSDISIPMFDLSNLGPRLQQYTTGISLFIEQPIFGIGGANFADTSQKYGLTDGLPIHNIYLSLLTETGFVGFVLYMSFLATILWQGMQKVVITTDTIPLQIAVLAGVLGYLGFMFWDHLLFNSIVGSFTFYTICATLVKGDQ